MTIAADKGRPLTNKEVPEMEGYLKIRNFDLQVALQFCGEATGYSIQEGSSYMTTPFLLRSPLLIGGNWQDNRKVCKNACVHYRMDL